MPSVSSCNPWTGYTKTASSVILITSGTICLSSDATVLTVSVSSADPDYLGVGSTASDNIRVCQPGSTHCTIGGGTDSGYFSGDATVLTCPSDVTQLPAIHD
jgi:hypothetical protein